MEWVQTVVNVVGILTAALVAVYVAAKQHNRQVLHQTKKDVAEALVVLDGIKQAFFEVMTMAEFATGETQLEDHDREEMAAAVESLTDPIQKLAALTRLLELTAPEPIDTHARNLLKEVQGFRTLMMTSFNAYMHADIKRRLGTPEPLRRLTTQLEYSDKYSSVEIAGTVLEMAAKKFGFITSVRYRIKNFFILRRFRSKSFGRKKAGRSGLFRVVKPRNLQKLVAEQQAKKTAGQAPAEKKPETEAQHQARLMAEGPQREHQRTADENLRGPGLGL